MAEIAHTHGGECSLDPLRESLGIGKDVRALKQLRSQISIAAGAGVLHEEIALGLGIALADLKREFAHELTAGAYHRRQEVLNATFKKAKAGNVTAAKIYLANQPRPAAPPPPQEPKVRVQPVGKKEIQHREAVSAQSGTEWENLLTGPAQ